MNLNIINLYKEQFDYLLDNLNSTLMAKIESGWYVTNEEVFGDEFCFDLEGLVINDKFVTYRIILADGGSLDQINVKESNPLWREFEGTFEDGYEYRNSYHDDWAKDLSGEPEHGVLCRLSQKPIIATNKYIYYDIITHVGSSGLFVDKDRNEWIHAVPVMGEDLKRFQLKNWIRFDHVLSSLQDIGGDANDILDGVMEEKGDIQ